MRLRDRLCRPGGDQLIWQLHRRGECLCRGWRYFSAIDFKTFTDSARVQFHGCSAAGEVALLDNTAKTVSELLDDAGKKNAFVIGHVTKSTPEFPGRPHTNENQDYRHGLRALYNRGEKAFEIRKAGFLSDSEILSRIGG